MTAAVGVEAKGGHRVIYVPYTAADGRTFHERREDNGGIPGVYQGFTPDGETWVCIKFAGFDDGLPPVRQGGRLAKWFGISHLDAGMYALFPDGWRWDEAAAVALVARHRSTASCDRCGAACDARTATLDARTVEERVYCTTCQHVVAGEMYEAMPTYREMQCRCGVMCYEQVSPATRERGQYHDVLPCPKCARLACAECLPLGAERCMGCVKTRRRRAA